jgi:hypothetical protein
MRLDTQFVSLLAITVRLHDLYDCRRAAKGTQQPSLPSGRGNLSGLWFELGVAALLYLLDKDEREPGAFVPQSEIAGHLQEGRDITKEDALTVLRYLQTACELNFPTFQPSSVLEQTALIEQAVAGSGFRISSSGRALFTHANLARRIDYTPDIISMLIKDIEHGRFHEFSQNCNVLIEIIRDHTQKIVRFKERRLSVESVQEDIQNDAQRHKELLSEAIVTIGELQDLLLSEEVVARIHDYQERVRDNKNVLNSMFHDIKRVIQACDMLARNIPSLFNTYYKTKAGRFAHFNIQKIADAFLNGGISIDAVSKAMSAHGFWNVKKYHCSLFDVPQKISAKKTLPEFDVMLNVDAQEKAVDKLFIFLGRHRDYIDQELRKGPMRLSHFFKDERFEEKGIEELAALSGFCLTPEYIEGRDFEIDIAVVTGEHIRIKLENGNRYVINEMEITLRGAAE